MQNLTPRLMQSSIISEKLGYFSEKLKTLTSSNHHRVEYFLLKFYVHCLLNNVYKWVFGIFLFCLEFELLIKM